MLESKVSALAASVSQLTSSVHAVRNDVGHLSRDSVVRKNPLPAAGSSDLPETASQGVFRTFPGRKKCKNPTHPGVGIGRGL